MIRASAGLSVVTLASSTPPVTRDRERWFVATTVVLTANPDAAGKPAMNARALLPLPALLPLQAPAQLVTVTACQDQGGRVLQLARRMSPIAEKRPRTKPATISFVK